VLALTVLCSMDHLEYSISSRQWRMDCLTGWNLKRKNIKASETHGDLAKAKNQNI